MVPTTGSELTITTSPGRGDGMVMDSFRRPIRGLWICLLVGPVVCTTGYIPSSLRDSSFSNNGYES